MAHPEIAQLAAVGGALGSALLLLSRGRTGVLAGLLLLAAAEGGMALSVSNSTLNSLDSVAAAAAAVVGLGVLCAAAAVLVRWPGLVPAAVLAAAPLRPPIDFNSSHRFLISIAQDGRLGRLLFLYFVLAASGLALGWRAVRREEMASLPRVIARPAAAFFALAFLSLLWADSVKAGVDLLAYFTLPFALLLAVVARATFPAWLPRALGVVAVALACLFAAVGLWQAATHELFFYAPNLEVSNANTSYFRVTSLFGDPSLYGRHLVLGLGVLLALLATRRAKPWPAFALIGLMWLGLLFSYSQSSMVALVVVTLAIGVATGDARVRRAAGVTAAIAVVGATGYVAAKVIAGGSLNQLTSDRTHRVEDAARVIRHHPLIGVGIGNQARVSRRLAGSDRPAANFVSHTTPLTVTAELGVVGLALYGWLLLGGVRLIAEVHRRDEALGLALGAAFLALFVHALFYSGFLEDPITWVVLGVGAGFLTWGRRAVPKPMAAAAAAGPAPVPT
jgi:putative inorganic carbon (hco3(-)) transporter